MRVTKEITMKCTEGNHRKYYVLQQWDCTEEKCNKCERKWACDQEENSNLKFKVRSDYGRMYEDDKGVEYQNRHTENSCTKSFATVDEAEKFYWKKYQEKLKKGYVLTFQRTV